MQIWKRFGVRLTAEELNVDRETMRQIITEDLEMRRISSGNILGRGRMQPSQYSLFRRWHTYFTPSTNHFNIIMVFGGSKQIELCS
jgi:hypothetical protein